MLQDKFSVIWWQSGEFNESVTPGLGPQTCTTGDYICSVKDDEGLQLQRLCSLRMRATQRRT
jgi:hypothetical protein